MQPTQNPSTTRPTRARHRALVLAAALALPLALIGCGSSGSSGSEGAAPDESTTVTELPDDTSAGGADTTTTVAEGTSDLDICSAISQGDIQAILTEATITSSAPNPAFPTPSCGYKVEMSGVELDVVTITWNEPGIYDSQKSMQSGIVELDGIEAFAYDDFGTVWVTTASGDFQIERGVELTEGGEAASQDQMTAIAELVAQL